MGLLNTKWEATYGKHALTVSRSELTRGFTFECDGREIAKKAWTLVGLGELEGTMKVASDESYRGAEREVSYQVLIQTGSECEIVVDGTKLDVRLVS